LSKKNKILSLGLLLAALTFLSIFVYSYVLNLRESKRLKAQSKQKFDIQLSVSASSKHKETTSQDRSVSQLAKIKPLVPGPIQQSSKKTQVVAWQPSHQDDTGSADWHEYLICGDIVDRTIAKAVNVRNIKCWDLNHGLTGSNNYNPTPINTVAFDSEVEQANQAGASYFISIHNDGGAPSGVLGEYLPGDEDGKNLTAKLVNAICAKTGLPNRGLREVRLYSLEYPSNKAKYKCLLEIGDNEKDQTFLENPNNRDIIAQSLAEVVNNFQ
jgi:hypothetical protein